jgi:hypothetical protein
MTTGHVESESSGLCSSCGSIDSAESTESAESAESTPSTECTESAQEAVMRIVAGLIRLRADTGSGARLSIGTPTRVVETEASNQVKFGDAGVPAASAFKIDFRCARGTRTCPISKEERRTDFTAVLRSHELTGLLAVYISCPPCAAKERLAGSGGSAGSGEYCFVGVLTESETRELEGLGAFEKARARIATIRAEMAKVTWQCFFCGESFTEGERPSFECCSEHLMNGAWVCEGCRSWNPCEPCEHFGAETERDS